MVRSVWVMAALALYALLFWQQERITGDEPPRLQHPMPAALQQAALGYLRQLGGENQFIRAAVFLGGIEVETRDPQTYAAPLAARLETAAILHPHFLDTYYLNQAMLPFIDPDYADHANRIHAMGMKARPDDYVLPFFVGFNHFYHLGDSVGAATYLHQAANLPGAPSWFGHLAGVLAGEGGDIHGGLMLLQAMLAGEEEEAMRERYRHSISMFERAAVVQEAVQAYRRSRGSYPPDLADLVPDHLPGLPQFDPPFVLRWEPPTLRLLRAQPELLLNPEEG